MELAITMDTLDIIDQYLKGTLTAIEKSTFERRMAEDAALREAVSIQKHLFGIHDFPTKEVIPNEAYKEELKRVNEKLQAAEYQALSKKIRTIGKEQKAGIKPIFKKKRKTSFIYSIAATIAVLLTTFLLFNRQPSLTEHYSDNVNWEELPSFITKGQEETVFTKGEILFKNKAYSEVITTLRTIPPENEFYPYALLYLGASYEQMNENQKAIATFDKVSQLTNFEEHSKGYWYKLLLYLKVEDRKNALMMKNSIQEDENNYNYKKAKKLDL